MNGEPGLCNDFGFESNKEDEGQMQSLFLQIKKMYFSTQKENMTLFMERGL